MASPKLFAVLQREAVAPSPEQLKGAFRSFSNLTDADAVRLAISSQGILVRHVSRDEAKAFQQALKAEGVAAALIAEDDLPKLPEAKVLHRLQLSPTALVIHDLLGRPTSVPWSDVALLAAGAVRHAEMTRTQTERTELRFNALTGVWPKKVTESNRKVQTDSQLLLDILLNDRTTRFQIDAARFPFNYVINEPALSMQEKFIWLVREMCRYAPNAILNGGARWLRAGHEPVPGYINRQALSDEMIWLLWHATTGARSA